MTTNRPGPLTGHVAIVTGSNKGIGAGIVRRLAADGAEVVVNGREVEAAERTAELVRRESGRDPLLVCGDLTDPALAEAIVEGAVERFGHVDIVVNNAWGGSRVNRLENKDPALFDRAFQMAFTPALRIMQRAFPHMAGRGWGRVVNVGSLNGVNAHVFTGEYNSSKEALRALTRTAAREWSLHGITANVVCPMARVERHDHAWGDDADRIAAEVGARLPAGRMGDPLLDVAGVVSFLCSDDARAVTGNTIFVDGGGHISGVAWNPVPEEETEGLAVVSAIHRTGRR